MAASHPPVTHIQLYPNTQTILFNSWLWILLGCRVLLLLKIFPHEMGNQVWYSYYLLGHLCKPAFIQFAVNGLKSCTSLSGAVLPDKKMHRCFAVVFSFAKLWQPPIERVGKWEEEVVTLASMVQVVHWGLLPSLPGGTTGEWIFLWDAHVT